MNADPWNPMKPAPIAVYEGMPHLNVDLEMLIICMCGNSYQIWPYDSDTAKKIYTGDISVTCPHCNRSLKEHMHIHFHSGGYYNASGGPRLIPYEEQ